jgi:hypothetical protein
MAKCFCITSGCRDQGGIDVDPRTLKKHTVKDKTQLDQNASEAANRVIEEEVNAVASHLVSQTLADNVSGLPHTHGGRPWAKWTSEELPDPIDITATYSPSRESPRTSAKPSLATWQTGLVNKGFTQESYFGSSHIRFPCLS